MIEFPEGRALAAQIRELLTGKTIWAARAAASPHGFAWYWGDPAKYPDLLVGATIDSAVSWGGQLEIQAGDARMVFCDGVNLRYHDADGKPPVKHQLQLTFGDRSTLTASVSMYGGLWAYREGENDNGYYLTAKNKPS
ncbi:MAG: endonuclease VIII, partial [Clostridiales bacterium]|nr:endonuclease VIII [Clostridiales bacterium]